MGQANIFFESPSASHSAGPPGAYLSVRRDCDRCEVIADDSAVGDVMQIINPLGIGTAQSYSASWVSAARPMTADLRDYFACEYGNGSEHCHRGDHGCIQERDTVFRFINKVTGLGGRHDTCILIARGLPIKATASAVCRNTVMPIFSNLRMSVDP